MFQKIKLESNGGRFKSLLTAVWRGGGQMKWLLRDIEVEKTQTLRIIIIIIGEKMLRKNKVTHLAEKCSQRAISASMGAITPTTLKV